MISFIHEINGETYKGTWKIEGDVLMVRSDYGEASRRLEGREPGTVARQLLERVVPRPKQ